MVNQEVYKHMQERHPLKALFACNQCGVYNASKKLLCNHKKVGFRPDSWVCVGERGGGVACHLRLSLANNCKICLILVTTYRVMILN